MDEYIYAEMFFETNVQVMKSMFRKDARNEMAKLPQWNSYAARTVPHGWQN